MHGIGSCEFVLIVMLSLRASEFYWRLFKHHCSNSVRSITIINAWNGLPVDHSDFELLPEFKRSLQRTDLSALIG